MTNSAWEWILVSDLLNDHGLVHCELRYVSLGRVVIIDNPLDVRIDIDYSV